MTIAIKHAFVSLKGDGTDSTQVQPSNWNAAHSLTLASGNVLGRLTAGAGAAEEIPISAYMANLLQAIDGPTLAGLLGLFETGDLKWTFKQTASAGWLLLTGDGSIGDATSGASLRANADTFALYTLIYAACSNTLAPVAGGRSGNATTDFNAHKAMTLPSIVGKAPIGAGAAAFGTSARTLGTVYGSETYNILRTDLPNVAPTFTGTAGAVTVDSTVGFPRSNPGAWSAGGGTNSGVTDPNTNTVHSTGTFTPQGNVQSLNGGVTQTAMPNMQPSIALNPMVKL
jgi:hypothetical protein